MWSNGTSNLIMPFFTNIVKNIVFFLTVQSVRGVVQLQSLFGHNHSLKGRQKDQNQTDRQTAIKTKGKVKDRQLVIHP